MEICRLNHFSCEEVQKIVGSDGCFVKFMQIYLFLLISIFFSTPYYSLPRQIVFDKSPVFFSQTTVKPKSLSNHPVTTQFLNYLFPIFYYLVISFPFCSFLFPCIPITTTVINGARSLIVFLSRKRFQMKIRCSYTKLA